MPEHVHLLILCSAKKHIHTIVSNIKGYLSRTLREEFPTLKSKLPSLWSRGKFISTVGSVSLEIVKQYIENQKKQNQKRN
jgi:putative transposase